MPEKTDPLREELHALQGKYAALKGANSKLVDALRAAEEYADDLEERLHKTAAKLEAKAPTEIPECARGARKLAESATIMAADGVTIITALVGDLIVVADMLEAKKLQRQLGAGYRVHAVTKDTAEALGAAELLG